MKKRIVVDTSTDDAGLLPGFLTKKQAAKKLGKSAHTLDRWYRMRLGPARIKIGRSVVYREEAIRTWLLSNEEESLRKGA